MNGTRQDSATALQPAWHLAANQWGWQLCGRAARGDHLIQLILLQSIGRAAPRAARHLESGLGPNTRAYMRGLQQGLGKVSLSTGQAFPLGIDTINTVCV